jgi:hypothetical protein
VPRSTAMSRAGDIDVRKLIRGTKIQASERSLATRLKCPKSGSFRQR